jgi:parallel beta-helix repeat protein
MILGEEVRDMGGLSAITCALLLVVAGSAAADMWFVRPDGLGTAPTIQAAVDSSSPGDTVVLANGTFSGEGNRDIVLWPKTGITVTSIGGSPMTCIIDCGGSESEPHRAFDIGSNTLTGVTVTNGWQEEGGALILGVGSDVSNCRFTGNQAISSGGAILLWSTYDWSTVRGCYFEGNRAVWGGGAVGTPEYYMVHVRFENCTFVDNEAPWGAAIYVGTDVEEWSLVIDGCTLVGNIGIGIYNTSYIVPSVSNTIVAYGTHRAVMGPVWLECCDVYGNLGGDWTDNIVDQLGLRGNFSACPSFCHADVEPYDFSLCDGSPCLPGNHPDGYDCGLIGAWGEGCVCGPTSAERTTWGAIKAFYR